MSLGGKAITSQLVCCCLMEEKVCPCSCSLLKFTCMHELDKNKQKSIESRFHRPVSLFKRMLAILSGKMESRFIELGSWRSFFAVTWVAFPLRALYEMKRSRVKEWGTSCAFSCFHCCAGDEGWGVGEGLPCVALRFRFCFPIARSSPPWVAKAPSHMEQTGPLSGS